MTPILGEPHDLLGLDKVPAREPDPQADLRRRYIAACAAYARAVASEGALDADSIDFTPFSDLICGARGKRTGRPCPQRGLYSNGRCRWHGGLSTGPKSPAGKARAMLNYRKGREMTCEAFDRGEVMVRVEPAPLGVSVAEAHEAADVPPLSASVGGAIDEAERAADPSITPMSPTCAPSEAAAYQTTAPRSPEESPEAPGRARPLQAIRACLAARPGRTTTPDRIAATTGLGLATVESGLRLLAAMGKAEPLQRGASRHWRSTGQ